MTFKKKGEYYTTIDKAKDLVPKFRENFQRFSKSDYVEITKARLGFDIAACPCCKTGRMVIVMQFRANAPPITINDKRNQMKNNTL